MVQTAAVDSAEGKNGGLRGRRPPAYHHPLEHGDCKPIKVLETDMFISPHLIVSIMEQYTPSPEARKQAIRIAAMSIVRHDETAVETIAKMSIACIETDFSGSVSTEQNEAIMTFNVAFMRSIVSRMESHMKGEWTTTPRDD